MPCQKNKSLPKAESCCLGLVNELPLANAPALATVPSFIFEDSQINHSDIEQSTLVTGSEQPRSQGFQPTNKATFAY